MNAYLEILIMSNSYKYGLLLLSLVNIYKLNVKSYLKIIISISITILYECVILSLCIYIKRNMKLHLKIISYDYFI